MAYLKMTREEWNKTIDDYIMEEQLKVGKPVVASIDVHNSWPQAHKLVTEEVIKDFAWNLGDNNPLFTDTAYAAQTRWGGVIAPPGSFLRYIAETGSFALGRSIPGVNHLYGGTTFNYYDVVRADDSFKIHDDYLGVIEKPLKGKHYRLLIMTCKRSYINREDRIICEALGNTVITCMYPGDVKEGKSSAVYTEKKRQRYSRELLDAIHEHYEDDLTGKFRRGSKVLYWEDVNEEEELKTLIKGPIDIVDIISFLCGTGAQLGGASTKWATMKNLLKLKDPETGEWMPIETFHYRSDIAHQLGIPGALVYGAQNEAYLSQLVTNWMGDDGFVEKMIHQHREPCFHGDIIYVKGNVARKYIENDEHLVEINMWTENQDGVKICPSTAVVRLLSKEQVYEIK